ncbi:hypothetical protein [uncultured Sphingomonas sp.]|uniref:hypothetical protein n=1 Tax=uncultured Sphingomonas sp. TaxID=158754 RepID=UPI0025DCF0C9|nr:hypothetical protein [uncultured Sphingomonas sp.]
MPKETPSPVDLPEPLIEDVGGLGWTSIVIALAAVVLLATNSVSLKDWIDDQPPSPVQAQAAVLADGWLTLMRTIGLALPRDALHQQWKAAEAARFSDGSGGNGAPAS